MTSLQLFPGEAFYNQRFVGEEGEIRGDVSNVIATIDHEGKSVPVAVRTSPVPSGAGGRIIVDGNEGFLYAYGPDYIDFYPKSAPNVTRIYKPKRVDFVGVPQKFPTLNYQVPSGRGKDGTLSGVVKTITWYPIYVAMIDPTAGLQSLTISGFVQNSGSSFSVDKAFFNTKPSLRQEGLRGFAQLGTSSAQVSQVAVESNDPENWIFIVDSPTISGGESFVPLYSIPLENVEHKYYLQLDRGARVLHGYQITTARPLPQAPVRVLSENLVVGGSTVDVFGSIVVIKVGETKNVLAFVRASNGSSKEGEKRVYQIIFDSAYKKSVTVNLEMLENRLPASSNPPLVSLPSGLGWVITVSPGKSEFKGEVMFPLAPSYSSVL